MRRFTFLLISAVFLTSAWSCRSLNRLQREVGMKQRVIKLKDLGSAYVKHEGTQFDLLSTKKSVRELTHVKPIKVKYRTFSLKKYDMFTKRANIIYTKFRYAKALNRGFDRRIEEVLDIDLKRESRKSVRRALRRKSSKKLKSVQQVAESYTALKLSLNTCREIIKDANELIKESDEIISQSKRALMKAPDKSILVDKVIAESKKTLERLQIVVTQSPSLVTSLKESVKLAKITEVAKDL